MPVYRSVSHGDHWFNTPVLKSRDTVLSIKSNTVVFVDHLKKDMQAIGPSIYICSVRLIMHNIGNTKYSILL